MLTVPTTTISRSEQPADQRRNAERQTRTKMKLNAEELAVKRFTKATKRYATDMWNAREGYAAAITELAQPLQDRVEELEAALEELLAAYNAPVLSMEDGQAAEGRAMGCELSARVILNKRPK